MVKKTKKEIIKEEVVEEVELDEEEVEEEVNDDTEIESNPIKKTMSDKTRYILIGIVSALLIAVIVVIAVFGKPNTKTDDKKSVAERNTSTETLKEFYKAMDSKELKLIFFARTSCGYCSLQKPILKQVAEDYNIDYYNIDTDNLEKIEVEEIIKALGIQGATPTSVIVKDGKVVATNEGYLDGVPYVQFLAKNGLIDKNATYKPEKNLTSINYSEFKSIVKKNEYSLVLLDSSACAACNDARSILSDYAEDNKFTVNHLSAAEMNQNDVQTLVEKDLKELKYDAKEYKKEKQVEIPLLLVIKDNKIKDYVLKSTDKSDYKKVLKKYGFIK